MSFFNTKRQELLSEQARLIEREMLLLESMVHLSDHYSQLATEQEFDQCVARIQEIDFELAEIES